MKLYVVSIALLLSFFGAHLVYGQDEITTTLDEAKKLYLNKELAEAAKHLDRALDLINEKLLFRLESLFPKPLKGWRADPPNSRIKKDAYNICLFSKRSYFKKGGGPSVDIILETNAPRIAQIRMIIINPSKIKKLDKLAKLSLISHQRCIERYDAIDKFAELIFAPSSTLLLSIRGHDMKNTDIVKKYACKIDWTKVREMFP